MPEAAEAQLQGNCAANARLAAAKEPEFPPVVGSILMALKNSGVALTPQVTNRIHEGIEFFWA